ALEELELLFLEVASPVMVCEHVEIEGSADALAVLQKQPSSAMQVGALHERQALVRDLVRDQMLEAPRRSVAVGAHQIRLVERRELSFDRWDITEIGVHTA